jgi:hypothetical protein
MAQGGHISRTVPRTLLARRDASVSIETDVAALGIARRVKSPAEVCSSQVVIDMTSAETKQRSMVIHMKKDGSPHLKPAQSTLIDISHAMLGLYCGNVAFEAPVKTKRKKSAPKTSPNKAPPLLKPIARAMPSKLVAHNAKQARGSRNANQAHSLPVFSTICHAVTGSMTLNVEQIPWRTRGMAMMNTSSVEHF